MVKIKPATTEFGACLETTKFTIDEANKCTGFIFNYNGSPCLNIPHNRTQIRGLNAAPTFTRVVPSINANFRACNI